MRHPELNHKWEAQKVPGQLQAALEVPTGGSHGNVSFSLPTPSKDYAKYAGLISQDAELRCHILLGGSREDLREKGSFG